MDITSHLHFERAEQLFDHVAPWKDGYSFDGYVFRGHSKESYALIPNALRPETKDSFLARSGLANNSDVTIDATMLQVECEFQYIRRFYKLADQTGLTVPETEFMRNFLAQDHAVAIHSFATSRRGISYWIPEEVLEVAALAQHYGVPTRLLDWSYDVYVAIYFATMGALKNRGWAATENNGNLVIWALNRNSLSLLAYDLIQFVTPHYAGNANLSAQKGIFTHLKTDYIVNHKDAMATMMSHVDRRPLDVVLNEKLEYRNNIFQKVTLPRNEALRCYEILEKLGYGTARLFPGYGGVAEQIRFFGELTDTRRDVGE